MMMLDARPNPLSLLRFNTVAAQANAPLQGALQSTWGITRGCRRELSGSHSHPTERRKPDERTYRNSPDA